MLEDLINSRTEIETEFSNLSNPSWIADKLKILKAQYDILTNIITKLESESTDAANPKPGRKKPSPNRNKR